MASNSLFHQTNKGLISKQVQPIIHLRLLYLVLILILPITSKSQEASNQGFKPSTSNNADKTGSGGGSSTDGKLVDFITGNPNQRSLPNNSQSQSYSDLYTRGLGHFLGGGGGGTSISTGQLGYYPPNYGPFGGIGNQQQPQFGLGGGGGGNKGLPYPGGPYPFPGQFPGFNQGGIGKQPYPQIPQQQFPFNPNPLLGPAPGIAPGGYFQQGFPGGQGYPYPGSGNVGGGGGGGDVGNLFFGVPKQIRVPGRIEISLNGQDAEIICEFPRFLILIQKVYWHHKYDDPYGTYYDSTNRFGPRVTVITPDKWKSILHIRNYNEDDFGTYRCLTTSILPDEGNSQYVDNRNNNQNQYLLRSPSTTTETVATSPLQQEYVIPSSRLKLPEKSKTRNGKDMKFPQSINRVTRRIRFSRSAISQDTSASRNHQYNRLDDRIDTNNLGTGSVKDHKDEDLTKQGSEEVYDPYYFQSHQDQEGPTARNYFLDHNSLNHPGNPYSTSTLPPLGGGHPLQDSRYNPLTGGGGYGNFPQQQGNSGYRPYAPYYKPSYGIFTIYQEIKFVHPSSRFGGNNNNPPRSNSHKL